MAVELARLLPSAAAAPGAETKFGLEVLAETVAAGVVPDARLGWWIGRSPPGPSFWQQLSTHCSRKMPSASER